MAERFHWVMALLVDLAANVASAEPYTDGKSTVNLRHPLAYAMMLRVPNVVPNTVQPMIIAGIQSPNVLTPLASC